MLSISKNLKKGENLKLMKKEMKRMNLKTRKRRGDGREVAEEDNKIRRRGGRKKEEEYDEEEKEQKEGEM